LFDFLFKQPLANKHRGPKRPLLGVPYHGRKLQRKGGLAQQFQDEGFVYYLNP
jgi:hypothetical protein